MNHRIILGELSAHCPQQQQFAPLVRFSKADMALFANRVEQCSNAPFPFLKLGITGFVALERLATSKAQETEYLNLMDFPNQLTPQVGIFINIPLLLSPFSLHTEFLISRSTINITKEPGLADFSLERTRLSSPILLRYTHPSAKFRPFVNAGPVFQWNFQNTYSFQRTPQPGQPIRIPFEFPDLQTGISAGVGLEYGSNHRINVFTELRHNILINPRGFNELREYQSGLVLGINF